MNLAELSGGYHAKQVLQMPCVDPRPRAREVFRVRCLPNEVLGNACDLRHFTDGEDPESSQAYHTVLEIATQFEDFSLLVDKHGQDDCVHSIKTC